MSNLLYPKLALLNIKKNGRLYIPYIITAICTLAMFYIMRSLSSNEGIDELPGSTSLKTVLGMGCFIIGLFSTIFLLYTNSFLMKRRKKELGLYNILGMEKRHISKIMLFETFFVAVISIVLGLAFGIVFDKLVTLLLIKILKFNVTIAFKISWSGVLSSTILFALIFLITLIFNVAKVRLSNPIELMHGSSVGEKEPKTKWVLAILGALSLGIAYYMALTIESPLDALTKFFIAVILVIIGTYLLFISGSIALLKCLRKNKKYYYNVKHFNSVSGMIYRMKQNAVGLANICILSTMVLVMVSTTVSMYIGTEDALTSRYPSDVSISFTSSSNSLSLNEIKERAFNVTNGCNRTVSDYKEYKCLSFSGALKGNAIITSIGNNKYSEIGSIHTLCIITADDYNNLSDKKISIGKDEVAIHSTGRKLNNQITLFDKAYKIKNQLDEFPPLGEYDVYTGNIDYIVVSDANVLNEWYTNQKQAYKKDASEISDIVRFNLDGSDDEKISCCNKIEDSLTSYAKGEKSYYSIDGKQENRSVFYGLYGSFLFLGIFLGFMFLMITVLIMYYKQISEGYDDKERFAIMQKVGMSKAEVKKSIHSQVITVFFLPLVAAIIHIAFAFKVITKLLALLNLLNVSLFFWCTVATIIAFAIIYAIVYALTAKTYYNIVE